MNKSKYSAIPNPHALKQRHAYSRAGSHLRVGSADLISRNEPSSVNISNIDDQSMFTARPQPSYNATAVEMHQFHKNHKPSSPPPELRDDGTGLTVEEKFEIQSR